MSGVGRIVRFFKTGGKGLIALCLDQQALSSLAGSGLLSFTLMGSYSSHCRFLDFNLRLRRLHQGEAVRTREFLMSSQLQPWRGLEIELDKLFICDALVRILPPQLRLAPLWQLRDRVFVPLRIVSLNLGLRLALYYILLCLYDGSKFLTFASLGSGIANIVIEFESLHV